MPEHLRRPDRTYPADLTDVVVANLEHLRIDALIPIGGDDTLSYAARLHQAGYPQVAIPKTMDNDVYGTDFCIGFSTAVTRAVQAISDLRTPIGSHERIGLVELFGRNSGETAWSPATWRTSTAPSSARCRSTSSAWRAWWAATSATTRATTRW
jgi:ATP-dependent phosphofructokinase / diphosphate-dependent phosphofructokinase